MSYRRVEYFAAGSWERLSGIINRWVIDHNVGSTLLIMPFVNAADAYVTV